MRVISNTFSLTAVPDVQASRPNLVHCSQFTKDRLGWWILPSSSNAASFGVNEGMYGIDGYNAYGVLARPGMNADIRQYLAKEYRASQADYNKETSNYALDAGKWYTLSFKVRGIAKKKNSDGSFSDGGDTRLYVYLVGYNGGGVSIVDTSEKYIVDGVEKYPSGDMNTSFVLNWTVSTHTITFKTRSDLKTISNHAVPVLYFRSFGEGHSTYPTYFANGGCLFRIAAIKIEEGMEATAYTPHATEMQPPVHAVAFKRDNTNISDDRPTGGTYTSPTPTGWSDGIPTGEARLWETKAVFVPELSTATLSAATWSKPSPVGDTSDSDVEFSPYDGTPTSEVSKNLAAADTAASPTTNKWFDPVRNAGADFTKMIWRAERQKRNGVWDEKWAIVKVKGETGKKGEDGKSGEDAVTIDIDNEMDSVPVNNEGVLVYDDGSHQFTVFFNVKMYKGASEISPSLITAKTTSTELAEYQIEGVTPVCIVSDNIKLKNIYYSYTFKVGQVFSNEKYEIRLPFVYGDITYYTAFALNAVRSGAKGEDAVIYQLVPSNSAISFKRDSNGSPTGSYTLTCRVRQTVGGISSVGSVPSGYSIKYGTNDANPCTSDFDSSKTISASGYADKKNIVLELYKDNTTLMDRETIPILIDGCKGEDGNPGSPGADATIAWLDCPYLAIQCDKDGKSKIDKFTVNAYMRVGDGNVEGVSRNYTINAVQSYTDTTSTTTSSTTGTLEVSISTRNKLQSVVITLNYAANVIQTITLLPVLDGALGADGYSYLPQVLGEYSPTQEYRWDNNVRQGCYYATDGRYNIYYVKKKETTLQGVAPNGTTEDENWEQSYRIFTIFTDAIYTPNANIGGFYLTNKLFMSSERAGQFVYVNSDYRYQGLWNETFTYKTRRIVYYIDNEDNGYYYVSKKSVIAGARPTNTSYWDKIVTGSPILAENKVEYLLKAVAGKPIGISFDESSDMGIRITAVSDTSSGYKTVRKNKNGEGWLIFCNNGTNSYDPTPKNNGWRYLTDTEYALLGITPSTANMEYEFKKVDIPRYVINGSAGIPATFMPDGSVWTYDGTGKQTIGNPEKQRLELTPSDGGLSFFGSDGSRVVTIDATSLTSSNLYGSNSGSFTLNTAANYSSYSANLAENTKKHKMTSQNVVLTGRVEISYSGTMSCFASLPSVTSNPRSYCSISLNVCKIKTDDYGVEQVTVVREIASLYSGGISKNNNISGSVSFDADGSTYSIYAIASYRQYYSGSELRYYLSLSECKYSNKSSITRVHANGFALGDASNNHFAAYNNNGVKMTAVNANAKLDFSSSGLSYTKGSYGGLLPITIWMGYVKLTDTSATITRRYGTISLNVTFESKGNCKLTLPSGFNMDNTFPTITTFQTLTNGANGVSAMIKEWSGTTMKIELNNDGSTADTAGFFLKLEYYA